jgi:SPP1 gp7 family putative phage head morphogenesis protein
MATVTSSAAPVPQKAIDFLGRKVNVETERWDDLKWGEHAHALTVAHSANAGVLDEIHRLLNEAVEKGISFQEFRNGMLDMMKANGWYGGAGHTKKDRRYINWRIGVIYDTNMRTAYAQADYRDRLEGAELCPIWVYRSQLAGDNRRQEHIALHGKAFRYDDSFWDTYNPPNGWGCECYVDTESEHSAEKAGIKVEDSKNITLPEIDPAWAYNVGREALAPNFSRYQNLPQNALRQIYASQVPPA